MAITKNTGFNEERTFGIEIEFFYGGRSRSEAVERTLSSIRRKGIEVVFEGYTHRTTRHWKLVTDSSVNYEGLEIVSPVLKGAEGMRELELVLEALNDMDAKVDRSCGIHVHHDVSDYDVKAFKSLYGIYSRYEGTIDSMMSPSRRGNNNSFCRGMNFVGLDQLRGAKTIEDVLGLYRNRYVKLNCASYRRQGTIEFRQHQGSTNYEKIASWLLITQMMVERSANSTVQLKQGVDDWFNFKKIIRGYAWMGADEKQVEAVTFMNKRIRELAS